MGAISRICHSDAVETEAQRFQSVQVVPMMKHFQFHIQIISELLCMPVLMTAIASLGFDDQSYSSVQ